MKIPPFKSLVFTVCAVSCIACSGASGTSTSSSSDASSSDSGNAAAAVTSLFSGFGGGGTDAQSLTSRFAINSTGADICDPDNLEDAPTGVFMSSRGGVSEHPLGSMTDPMTISSEYHYCVDSDNQANSGTGPDGQGLFASFTFIGQPRGDCSDGGSFAFVKGSGILRNTQDYYPEIFGRFEISGGDIVNCTLRLRDDGTVALDQSSCTDDDGGLVSLDTTVTCEIDADIAEIEDPDFYKGHYGLGESSERNLNYDCVNYDGFEIDDDRVLRVVNDCSALTDAGFNVEFLSIGAYAADTSEAGDFSSWEIAFSGTSQSELRTQIQLLHAAGLQVALAVDILYFEDPENPDDNVDFPAALIDNPDFQADLTAFIGDQAQFAQRMGADIFIPLSESDRVFALSSVDDDEFLAGIMGEIAGIFTGKLGYVWSYDIDSYSAANLAAFDMIGFNRSPQGHDHLDENCSGDGAESNCILEVIGANLASQRDIVNEVNGEHGGHLIHFIDSLGVWGAAAETEQNFELPGTVDWMADATVAAMFEGAFELAIEYEASGFVAWEGTDGEFVFPGQTLTLDAITQGFLAW